MVSTDYEGNPDIRLLNVRSHALLKGWSVGSVTRVHPRPPLVFVRLCTYYSQWVTFPKIVLAVAEGAVVTAGKYRRPLDHTMIANTS